MLVAALFFPAPVLAGGYPQQGLWGHLMAQEPQRTTINININYPLLIASLECGPQLGPPPCHQVGSGPPPVLVPLPALGFDLLVAGSIALGGAACCVLPMSSAGLKNPLSSLLLFSEFLRRFQGQKLPPLWLTICFFHSILLISAALYMYRALQQRLNCL